MSRYLEFVEIEKAYLVYRSPKTIKFEIQITIFSLQTNKLQIALQKYLKCFKSLSGVIDK